MRDLERRTGVHRETLTVYFRHGLLLEPARPAANVADYDDSHVQAILAARQLQRDDGLTLPQLQVALRGQNDDGWVDSAAVRTLTPLVTPRVAFVVGALIPELVKP